MFTRRDFIKTMSLLSGAALAPVRWLGKWASQLPLGVQPVLAEEPPVEGELYAGFVLLPEGARVPEYVKYPRIGIPKLCGVGDSVGSLATTESYRTDVELASRVHFPIYTIKEPLLPLIQKEAYLTKHSTEEIYCSTICFGDLNTEQGTLEWQVFLWAYPDFPRPYPLWDSKPVEIDGPFISLEKVDFLPQPAIMSSTPRGFIFYWIEADVLYMAVMEPIPEIQDAQAIIAKLVRI